MSVLSNFPMVSQETLVTGDNKPSENRLYDCVAASIDAACRYLLNQPENSVFNPDHFKDETYGDRYIGGTAATKYVNFCKSLGIDLYSVQGSNAQLVALAHSYLAENKPVIFTEPDPYSDTPGMTHVCVFYADQPMLTAMDPFPLPGTNIGHAVLHTDADWVKLLQFNEIWIAERIEDNMPAPIDLNNSEVASFYSLVNGNQWLSLKTKTSSGAPIVIHGAILSYYQACGSSALHGLLDLGLPVSNEIPLDSKGNTRQHFERGVLFYDPAHVYDSPPGSGSVYHAHIYSGPGQDPEIAALNAKLTQLQQQPDFPQMHADILQAKAIFEKYS